MKRIPVILIFVSVLYGCGGPRYTPSAIKNSRSEYIATYSDIAIEEMIRTGVPASVKMAQAIFESGDGNSTLATRANNHFGIKCHDWSGRRIYHDDDERNECFRRYSHVEESFRDHSDFLTGRTRYAALFSLDQDDYKGWARGLKASGYATNPSYDRLLIRIIEENELYKLDAGNRIRKNARPDPLLAGKPVNKEPAVKNTTLTRNRIKYVIAAEGDSYESITRENGLMNWELSRYNDIPADTRLNAGDIIYLQPKRNKAERGNETHVVKEGETMLYISQLYGVKLDRLLRMNLMNDDQEPEPGMTIYLRRQRPEGITERGLRPEYNL